MTSIEQLQNLLAIRKLKPEPPDICFLHPIKLVCALALLVVGVLLYFIGLHAR